MYHGAGAQQCSLYSFIFPLFFLLYWLCVAFSDCDGRVVKMLHLKSQGSSHAGLSPAHSINRWNMSYYTYRCASFRNLSLYLTPFWGCLSRQTFMHSYFRFKDVSVDQPLFYYSAIGRVLWMIQWKTLRIENFMASWSTQINQNGCETLMQDMPKCWYATFVLLKVWSPSVMALLACFSFT